MLVKFVTMLLSYYNTDKLNQTGKLRNYIADYY